MSKIAVVRIRGTTRIRRDFVETLKLLNLNKKNSCVVLDSLPGVLGMVKKVKDFVAWGEVNEDTANLLAPRKKGKFFALMPPKGGFEKKGIKMPFNKGGALGYRGDKINDLLKRMV